MAQIDKPNTQFNTVLYTGNGTSQSVTGTGFLSDLLWLKERDGADYHFLNDTVRGIGTNGHYLNLHSNSTNGESNQTNGVNSINSNGFDITYRGELNENGKTYVSWNWKAGGTAVSNTAGSITSSVSANTTSGFSIVSYSGDGGSSSTVGHGLGAIPKMVIIKCRTSTPSWQVWGDGYTRLSLNNTDGDLASYGMTRGVSTFSLPSGVNDWNGSGLTYIAYCFAEKKGFSKFGSYVGNGSADGTFVYTGFKPAFVLCKRSDATSLYWFMFDNKRIGYNPANYDLYPNVSEAESGANRIDLLSNGFKIRSTSGNINPSGGTMIYMAFAENPLVGSNNIPTTAR